MTSPPFAVKKVKGVDEGGGGGVIVEGRRGMSERGSTGL